ncbi:hypothetical protein JTE90_020206 [Oedothorax gibbosus]|uniref:Uncharacterized protein n=1 Tax=Oedothorax gibbosus TaxID=931172 RepID=A0AAV6THP1_9ARAC|nr:hypothetical protein JTE90_020206 [Oedothorax gibbosus]
MIPPAGFPTGTLLHFISSKKSSSGIFSAPRARPEPKISPGPTQSPHKNIKSVIAKGRCGKGAGETKSTRDDNLTLTKIPVHGRKIWAMGANPQHKEVQRVPQNSCGKGKPTQMIP